MSFLAPSPRSRSPRLADRLGLRFACTAFVGVRMTDFPRQQSVEVMPVDGYHLLQLTRKYVGSDAHPIRRRLPPCRPFAPSFPSKYSIADRWSVLRVRHIPVGKRGV